MLFYGLPIPCTANRLFTLSRSRLIKSSDYRAYESQVVVFSLYNKLAIEKLKEYCKPFKFLKVDTYFAFYRKKLIGLKGEIKSIDASNRIKIAHDVLSKLIDKDDKYFVCGHFEKIIIDDSKKEQVIFNIQAYDTIFNLNEIKDLNERL